MILNTVWILIIWENNIDKNSQIVYGQILKQKKQMYNKDSHELSTLF